MRKQDLKMTVEATSFLSNTKISNGHEKSAKFLKNHKNLIIFLLAFVLLLFCILASILQLWIYNRLNKAQEEIDQLKKDVIELKSNGLDHDLLAEIAEFNRKYNNKNDVKDQIDLDEKVNFIDEKVKFDEIGDDVSAENSEETDDEDDEDNYEGYHSGYGEEYDDEYDLDSLEDLIDPESDKKDDENNIYKDMAKHTRKTRSLTGITEQGVPIHEEPYYLRRNRTKSQQDKHPKLKLTWNGQYRNLNSPRREHDRNRQHMRHHHSPDYSNKFAFAAAPVHHAFESPGPRINETQSSATPIPIQTRQSRVMHFEDKSKAFRQVVGKEQLAKLKEQRMPPPQYVNHPNARRRIHPQNMSMRKNLEMKNGKRMKITAVHYDGDSTKLEEMRHHSAKGNSKVVLNKNEYLHWKPAEWVLSHGMDKYFHMDSTGTLTVNDHGLFLIYAQVYYSDTHDVNGYEILQNHDEIYRCTTMTHMNISKDRINSCYTSGLIHLRNGDRIRLRDMSNHRNVLLEKSRSYFGLIKINLTPTATHSNENSEVDRFEQIK